MLFTSLTMLLCNMIVFMVTQSDEDVNKTLILVFTAIIAGILWLPVFVFLIFHLYLTVTRQTTR